MIWFLISIAIILFWVFNMDHTKIASFKSHNKGERTLSRKESKGARSQASDLLRATSLHT